MGANQALQAANPDKPWLWRQDWLEGYAEPEWKATAAPMAVIGAAFLALSAPMLVMLRRELERHNYPALLALVFPIAAVYLIGHSLVQFLRSRKFRGMRLKLSSVPSALGGDLHARLETRFVFPPGETVELTLSCIHSYESGSGKNRSRWETVLWQTRNTAAFATDGQDSFAPCDFAIPFDARETDTRHPGDMIVWRVAARARLSGLDFRATFLAPVFKTAASDPARTAAVLEAHETRALAGVQPQGSQVKVAAGADGRIRFYFGRARAKQVAAALTFFGAIFLAGGVFFGVGTGRAFTWIIGAIPLIFAGGIGILLLAIAVWLWFGSVTAEVLNREIHLRSSCLGLSRRRVFRAAEIQGLDLKITMQSGGAVWYNVVARLANGRSATLGNDLEKPEAEWYRAELQKDLGLPPP